MAFSDFSKVENRISLFLYSYLYQADPKFYIPKYYTTKKRWKTFMNYVSLTNQSIEEKRGSLEQYNATFDRLDPASGALFCLALVPYL